MLIFEIFVSLWLNDCDGCVTLQDLNFVTVGIVGRHLVHMTYLQAIIRAYFWTKPMISFRMEKKGCWVT